MLRQTSSWRLASAYWAAAGGTGGARGTAAAAAAAAGAALSTDASATAAAATQAAAANATTATITDPSKYRNWCIMAHVDHGKTTLFDRLLTACGVGLQAERAMDSGVLERERGITIMSKITSFEYKGHVINALDTPGHADFGGEVERCIAMVDGAVLLVDAVEGPLAQTKFVLQKALAAGLAPLVVLNKVDRPAATQARCDAVASELFDLFAALGASDEQLDFPVLYASARQGWAAAALPPPGAPPPLADGMRPLLEAIIARVPPPAADPAAPFKLLVGMVERDPYVGRLVTGRVASGSIKVGDRVRVLQHPEGGGGNGGRAAGAAALDSAAAGAAAGAGAGSADGSGSGVTIVDDLRVTRIEKRVGMGKAQLTVASAGDIVTLAGTGDAAGIADTVAAPTVVNGIDPGRIDPPTLSMVVSANDSPLAGRSGRAVTGRALGERLLAEAEGSVSLRVAPARGGGGGGGERYEVRARGELQLGVLIETLRREGYEFSVSPPAVVERRDASSGQRLEPVEAVTAELPAEHAGAVIEALGLRRGELLEMGPALGVSGGGNGDDGEEDSGSSNSSSSSSGARQRLVFEAPSRGLIGFRSQFANLTRGEGLLQRAFARWAPHRGALAGAGKRGAIVATQDGRATAYALDDLAPRGAFYIAPGDDVYAGMVVGVSNKPEDVEANVAREKKLTNVRSVQSDDKLFLAPPKALSLEDAIGLVGADELIEVTPAKFRIRKAVLDAGQRARLAKRAAAAAAAGGGSGGGEGAADAAFGG